MLMSIPLNIWSRCSSKRGDDEKEPDQRIFVISVPVIYNNEIWGYIAYYHSGEKERGRTEKWRP